MSVDESQKKGCIFVISGPAGTGKTTLVQKLTSELDHVVKSVSFTTRSARHYEIAGEHYHFIDEKEFRQKIVDGDFIEHVNLFGNFYGTSLSWIKEQTHAQHHVVLVIDVIGAMQLMDRLKATYIFIAPPSVAELESRMRQRQTETEEDLLKRLKVAEREIKSMDCYDYMIKNDSLETAYTVLQAIVLAEEQHQNKLSLI